MTISELHEHFYQQIHPSRPNEWEVDELLEKMVALSADEQNLLLSFVHVIWPVSHSLCFSFLEYGIEHSQQLRGGELDEWIRQLLGCYEKDGLRGARVFMADTLRAGSNDDRGGAETRFEEMRGRLLPFIRGVSGRQLELSFDKDVWTDSGTIYLPEYVSYFGNSVDNERYFTFLTCCQWGYIALGTLEVWDCHGAVNDFDTRTGRENVGASGDSLDAVPAETFFATFSDPDLARNIFHFLEFSRVYKYLSVELPGLMRHVRPLILRLTSDIEKKASAARRGYFAELFSLLLTDPFGCKAADNDLSICTGNPSESYSKVADLYGRCVNEAADNDWLEYQSITGKLRFDKAREFAARRREEQKQTFIQQLAAFINTLETRPEEADKDELSSGIKEGDAGKIVISPNENSSKDRPAYRLKVDSMEKDLPADIAEMLAAIHKDKGHIPEGYVQAAAGIAGTGKFTKTTGEVDEVAEPGSGNTTLYDEWDYRRKGYRKNWCALIEKDIQPVRSQFVENTLLRHRGVITRLRRQFELLRTQHRFTRRRRYGDDIDFDALVEAVGDRQAGLAPSERLFIRLLRDERDIAVMFLVDMSNSTEGWVGKAIKESLVLLGDVLEIVGDRYAIYGFSGMRRSRCELFKIKDIHEPYSKAVQQRICAISPREYTRMATPLRHLTRLMMDVDARVRLLITISDGKPEDYDGYKGEYAIEDTRQALIEARGKGIIPFCITVDKEPHAYLPHMFGEGNYIYVNSVEKLPQRMPEIYRLLTS